MNMGKIDYIHTVQPGTGGIDDAFLNRYVLMSGDQMIPYCLWNNRGQGEMIVWVPCSGAELS